MGSGGQNDDRGVPAYAGWVFHVGTSSLGYQFCRPRFLVIRSKYVTMFKSDPNEIPRPLPMRSGLVGSHLMVEEVGRREIHNKVLYVLKIYSKLDDSRQGEFACDTPEEVEKWISAFRHAKEEAEISSSRLGSGYRILDSDDEFDINGRRKDSRAMSRGFGKLITIGRGPEALLRRPSVVTKDFDTDGLYNHREGDTFETTDWKCFYTVNGLRIFEDVASKAEKGTIMKSVGVVDGAPETIFEFIMSLEKSLRSQWDIMIGDLQLVEQIDGHTDIVYGSFDPKYFKRFQKKSDFLFSRYWRRDQDGSYSVTQISTTHKKWPPKSGFNRMNISPGIWEITPLPPKPVIGTPRCLVTQIIEVKSTGWGRWKRSSYSKFHTSIPYILLCRTAGLRELVAANPEHVELESQVETKEVKKLMEEPGLGGITSLLTQPSNSFMDTQEEFYDALMIEDPEEEAEEKAAQGKFAKRTASQKFKGISYGIMLGLSKSKKIPETKEEQELDWHAPTVFLDEDIFQSGLRKCVGPNDTNGWSDPGAKNFMVRGLTYNDDGLKIPGGDPLIKLLAVDWLKSEKRIDHIAKQSNCCVQSDAGKKAPFILVINLQVPAKANYSLVSYFVADRPIRRGSLLDRFANGDNAFRNARFKLIPSIVEGYWVVKRAVGTKACLLGRAVTCNYLREDNFLEIDVDIGSSSVARNVVGLVLGYITSIVVDLAVLIEATNADELPEYVLGTVRIDRMKLESAIEI